MGQNFRPHYHASAMDGYALRAPDTRAARDQSTRVDPGRNLGRCHTGVRPAQAVNTGAPLPIWADTAGDD
ncbi:MAG: hypothetical protein IPL78_33845 [Chloroflexi bacterium]|nr:hypothetical protein [Chloroflexota bacterium]